MKTKTFLISLVSAAALVCSADEFSVSNFPAVNSVRENFASFECPWKDGFSRNVEFWKTQSAETKTNFVEGLVQVAQAGFTNEINVLFENPGVSSRYGFERQLVNSVDARLADAGVVRPAPHFWSFIGNPYADWPHCVDAGFNRMDEVEAAKWAPVRNALQESLANGGTLSVGGKIAILVAQKANGWQNEDIEENLRNNVIDDATKTVRHELRRRNLNFFTDPETGKNPVQDAIDALVTGLESAKCAGVKEWVQEWCPDYQWVDITTAKTDAEIDELKESVYYGDTDFTDSVKQILKFNLGIEGYNQFIERYNSGNNPQ